MEQVDALSFSKDSAIITDEAIYKIDLLGDITTATGFEEDIAYIDNNVFYLYRGFPRGKLKKELKPGIYKETDTDDSKFYLVEPVTDAEKEEFNVTTHIHSLTPTSIIDEVNTKEDLLIAIPESTKVFQPVLSKDDDILKRAAKLALIKKNVDLDKYKNNFTNKNELFNFKQVIRNGKKLSILIFNRGIEALNLKYELVISEKGDTNIVGTKLEEPIVVSSEDTYDL